MAQHDYDIENSSFPAFRTNLNGVLSAINSSNSGSSRPSSAVAGTIWLDTSGAATAQLLKMYDGAADILLGTVNFTANTVDFADSASSVADDSITLAKLASGTDGNIISYDASGNPVAVATGSSGQVLTSAGAGAVPSFQTVTGNATHSGEVTGATALTIADNIVDEANLKVSNAPVNGYMLTAQSGNTGGMTWAAAGGGTVLKVYQKSFVGGHTIAGSSSSWRAVSHYVTPTITPISSSSKFLIQWNISGYANDDHHFFKIRRDIGGSVTDVGLSASNMTNHTDYGESGSLIFYRHTNAYALKTMQIADAPATASGVFWQLYNQAHGQTFYFGRSGHNPTNKQYASQNTVTIWELDGSKATFSQETSY